jgi:hypothetical protein
MNLGTHMPDGERRKHIAIEVCRSKVLSPLSYKLQYQQASSSYHQACVYQGSFRSNISFLTFGALLIFKYTMVVFHWLYIESSLVAIPSFWWVVGWLSSRRQIFSPSGKGQARTKINCSFIIYGKSMFSPLTIRHVCTKIHLDPTFRS